MNFNKGIWGLLLLLVFTLNSFAQDSTAVSSEAEKVIKQPEAPDEETTSSEEGDKQEKADTSSSSSKFYIPKVTFNGSLLNYKGDIGEVQHLGSVENMELGASLHLEFHYNNLVALDLFGLYGFISQNERTSARNNNFRTGIMGGGLNLLLPLNNGFILPKDADIKPFLFGGIGFMNFSPRADLYGDEGKYYYWSDGGVWNKPEGTLGAKEIARDYIYETDLTVGATYSTNALFYPVGLGFDFKITHWIAAQGRISYNFTNTDYLDNTKVGTQNDAFWNGSLGVTFNLNNFGKGKKEDDKSSEYEDIDFDALLKADQDADGVPDIEDICPDTDEGIKVNSVGCPSDKDGDGIPDHLDKDNETPKGEFVDTTGIGIPDSVLAQQANDTIVTLRDELCLYYPSMCRGDETDIEYQILNTGKADKSLIHTVNTEMSDTPIEEIIKKTDSNKNKRIESKEIYEAIDGFFEGKLDIQLGDIHKLIDHFFEQ